MTQERITVNRVAGIAGGFLESDRSVRRKNVGIQVVKNISRGLSFTAESFPNLNQKCYFQKLFRFTK